MTTPNKTAANKRNALQSTGPTSPTGRSKSSKNALRHGFYAAAVVPAAGESVEEFNAFCESVHEELAPEGVMACRLVDRVALILWRLDRVMRYEAAVATHAIGARETPLPPDPDAITGKEIEMCPEVPEWATPAFRLAYARARVKGWVPVREAFQTAALALGGGGGNRELVSHDARMLHREIGEMLGWAWIDAPARWDAAVAARGTGAPPLVGDALRAFVCGLAVAEGLDPDLVVRAVVEGAVAHVAEYDRVIAEQQAEEAALVPQMRAARNAALAAGLYSDGDAVERVMRMEAHLTRQLGHTLDLLKRLQGNGPDDEANGAGRLIRQLGVGGATAVMLPESVGSFRNGEGHEVGEGVPNVVAMRGRR